MAVLGRGEKKGIVMQGLSSWFQTQPVSKKHESVLKHSSISALLLSAHNSELT